MTVCEDMWQPGPPATDLALAGAELIVNISASPFHLLRDREREEMFRTRARDNSRRSSRSATRVGGQDELIFDGHSLVIDDEGTVLARAEGFEEDAARRRRRAVRGRRAAADATRAGARSRRIAATSATVEVMHVGSPHEHTDTSSRRVAPFCDDLEQMRLALELGLGDYVRKNGFNEIVVGVSGGIDSALVAALAAEALGPERVHCVSMPSRYSSEGRAPTRSASPRISAATSARSPIEPIVETFLDRARAELRRARAGPHRGEPAGAHPRHAADGALEQVRLARVATGNKSELSVGYATLYGDMAGGFALLKDVYKTDVFRLARHLNERAGRELIPQSIIDRAPSAELRDDQLDEDSLPPYPQLDQVLEAYVEEDRTLEELSSDGFDPDVVKRAVALIDRAEYKRRQAPPGVRLRPKAFGRDRRTPITNRWRS